MDNIQKDENGKFLLKIVADYSPFGANRFQSKNGGVIWNDGTSDIPTNFILEDDDD